MFESGLIIRVRNLSSRNFDSCHSTDVADGSNSATCSNLSNIYVDESISIHTRIKVDIKQFKNTYPSYSKSYNLEGSLKYTLLSLLFIKSVGS